MSIRPKPRPRKVTTDPEVATPSSIAPQEKGKTMPPIHEVLDEGNTDEQHEAQGNQHDQETKTQPPSKDSNDKVRSYLCHIGTLILTWSIDCQRSRLWRSHWRNPRVRGKRRRRNRVLMRSFSMRMSLRNRRRSRVEHYTRWTWST